ncbi:MAG: glycosyltransferase family 2 protein [Gammaproteobacteria bacterium]|nr:glycosyltransferase family 2 protein [Gammaproteobacteria bacterium]MBU1722342.1 glycosyltransferase family 2 protein [Gammaproteobacteria bacterium]MBU2004721.1 glycosyltransferase family 2 protein [Gammaproteobacteria bacterium]
MSTKPTLAAALIVKNEAENLRQCLETVAGWVDEIVIMDSGSSDDTLAIAQSFGAKIFTNTDWPGFGKQRQLTQNHVQSDWILWLDADERVTPALRDEIQGMLRDPPADTVFAMPRLSWAFGRFIRHSGWYPGYVMRFYPTHLTTYDNSLVHEKVIVPPQTKVQYLRSDLIHYPYRDIQHYLVKVSGYTASWAQQQKEKGKKVGIFQGISHAIACFIRMYIFKAGFLDGVQGLILAMVGAYTTFIKYADLWVLTHAKHPEGKS